MVLRILLIGFAALAARGDGFLFVDVSAQAGLDYELTPPRSGAAVGDFDLDGLPDVSFAGGVPFGPQLYRNNGDGTFSNVTSVALPTSLHDASHSLMADLDNDGDPDLIIARRYDGNWRDTGFYYYENIAGVFWPSAQAGEPARDPTSLGGLAVADLDNDGHLDVVFAHNGANGGVGGPGFLLRNDNGAFSDATTLWGGGFNGIRRHWSAVAADFNGDGRVDVHAAVDFGADFQCRNVGYDGFSDVSASSGVTNVGSDMGLAIGDIENDGDLDIYSTNIYQGVLYRNNGQGQFEDRAAARGVAFFVGTGWGATFSDLDHDRDEDLVCVTVGGAGELFENDGAGFFTTATGSSGLALSGQSLTPFDYDLDGDLDLLILDREGLPRLYENRSALGGRHWLNLRLAGARSNRDSVGARVRVTAGGVTQTRVILGGYSFFAGPPMEAHFGLGDAAVAERVAVRWPSGARLALTNVAADQFLTLAEPANHEQLERHAQPR